MKNVLVVNVNWLGDVVFSTPVFKAIKKAHPDSHVICLGVPRVKEVLEHCPYIDEVMVYDEKGAHRSPWGKLMLIFSIRDKNFDTVFLLHRSLTRALFVFLAGIPYRVGYHRGRKMSLLTHKVRLGKEALHRSDEYMKLVEGFGIPVEDRTCELSVREDESRAVNAKLAQFGITEHDKLVIVNPGGNWDLKRWPSECFSQLVMRLAKDFNVKVLISGAEKDVALAQKIAAQSGVKPFVWAGATTVKELLALFKRADVVISNDTGPVHVAASVGTDVIAIFGPTRPEVTGPRGSGRAVVLHREIGCNYTPCYHLNCPQNVCMRAITVDDVLKAFQTLRNS